MVAGAAFSYSMSYCGSPPVLDTLWTRWNFDPVLIAALVACALLGMALLRGPVTGGRSRLRWRGWWPLCCSFRRSVR